MLIDMLSCDTDSTLGKIGMQCHSSPGDLYRSEKHGLVKWMFDLVLEGWVVIHETPKGQIIPTSDHSILSEKYIHKLGATDFHAKFQIWRESMILGKSLGGTEGYLFV